MSKIFKIFSGSRTAKVNIMANMSASILREIVARTFNVKATLVILSGEIAPDVRWVSNSCWSSQTTEHHHKIFSFCVEKGFHKLDVVNHTQNNNDGTASNTYAKHENLASALEAECPESIFIVEVYDCTSQDDNESCHEIRIYKSPNWREHIQKIKTEDIARWEQWLKE